jgi:sorting nexin-1/2
MPTASVTEPSNHGEGRNMYTTYSVTSDSHIVNRRYSDFCWLYGRLEIEFPGAIFPIIPHKRTLTNAAKFSPEIIEERRQNLDHFLKAVVAHQELARAPSMTPFMTAAMGDNFDLAKKAVEQSKPGAVINNVENNGDPTTTADEANNVTVVMGNNSPSKSEKAMGAAKKGINSFFAKAVTLTKLTTGTTDLYVTENEEDISKIRDFINAVDANVKQLVTCSHALIKSTHDKSTAMHELGVPIAEWKLTYQNSISEGDDLLDMMSAFVEFSGDFSTLLEKQYEEEQHKLEGALQQLTLDVKAFQNALNKRRDLQVKATTHQKQIADKQTSITKAKKAYKTPEVTDKLLAEREVLEKKSKVVVDTLEQCSERVLREAKREQPKLQLALRDCLGAYAEIQINYGNKMQAAWSQLLPYVGAGKKSVEDTTNGLPLDPPPVPPAPSAPKQDDEDEFFDST